VVLTLSGESALRGGQGGCLSARGSVPVSLRGSMWDRLPLPSSVLQALGGHSTSSLVVLGFLRALVRPPTLSRAPFAGFGDPVSTLPVSWRGCPGPRGSVASEPIGFAVGDRPSPVSRETLREVCRKRVFDLRRSSPTSCPVPTFVVWFRPPLVRVECRWRVGSVFPIARLDFGTALPSGPHQVARAPDRATPASNFFSTFLKG